MIYLLLVKGGTGTVRFLHALCMFNATGRATPSSGMK